MSILLRVDSLPVDVEEIRPAGGLFILSEIEAVEAGRAVLFIQRETGLRFLWVREPATLHRWRRLPDIALPGLFRVVDC
jgi:hypothetical protein